MDHSASIHQNTTFESLMKNLLLTLAATTLLGACGFMTPAKQYAGDRRDTADIAVIQASVGVPFSDEVHATISGYTGTTLSGEVERKTFGIKGFTDYPHAIHLAPGEFDIQLYCFRFPSIDIHKTIRIQARPGYTYLLKCAHENGETKAVVASSDKSPLGS